LKWKYETGDSIFSSPAVRKDGVIYVGSTDNNLYAITQDGHLKWKNETGDGIFSSPAIGKDGTVYVGSLDNHLYAITFYGHLKWKYETGDSLLSSPAIGEDGTVYVGSNDNYIHAVSIEGKLKWKYETGDSILSSPVIGEDGAIYVGSGDNHLYAFGIGGFLKWKYETGWRIYSNPAIGSDGIIYIGSWDNNLYAISSDGELQWKFKTDDLVRSSPTIGMDGTIYVGSWDNHIYAIRSSSTGPTNSSWPKFRKAIKNSGSLCQKIPNMLPDIQGNPYPPNNAKGININPILKWECDDLDGDSLTYYIYIGINEKPSLKEVEYPSNIYSPGPLSYNTTYYWKIVAIDEKGGITEGPLWKLTTKEESSTEWIVLVEGGTFHMGNTWGDGPPNEKPVHEVNLTYDFYMGKYEVTFEEYGEYCEDTGKSKPNDRGWGRGKHPVINVSWYDAIEYCNWLSEQEGLPKAYDEKGNLLDKYGIVTTDITKVEGYRLPTEAEWEYAARGGNESKGYKYAGSNYLDEVAWYDDNSGGHPHEVGMKEPNELGIYDMSGNVYEWCQDWWYYYTDTPKTNPYNHQAGSSRVVRSGSWYCYAYLVRVANRNGGSPVTRYNYGFRVCRTAY
jgi:formylglycine-generating enzyme required for sulfatase activity/outer membrane protein assembly factor BamB